MQPAALHLGATLEKAGIVPDASMAQVRQVLTVGRCTLCILLPTPPPRRIGWNMCRPMRRLNDVCVGQSEGCLPLYMHRYITEYGILPIGAGETVGLCTLNQVDP
jgi:hypothetical protein